ncbi:MAG: DsbA family protein [Chloroflexi bacterium]|nr:DsbA family protein [Chloroflexota bacterium]
MTLEPPIEQKRVDETDPSLETKSKNPPNPYATEGAVIVIPRTTFNYVVIGIVCLSVGIFLGATLLNPMRGNDLTFQNIRSAVEDVVTNSALSGQAAAQKLGQPINVSVDDDPSWGSEDAPVTIVEFSDFQCPFCGRFHRETYDQLRKDYEGKIRFVYRDFPIVSLHPNAEISAEAADCANEQGKYWEYHDLLLNNQDKSTGSDLSAFASQLGLDMTVFNQCMNTRRYQQEVAKDVLDANSYGVTGTPTFFINGQPLVGAQPYAVFASAIDAELAKSTKGETTLPPG